MDKANILWVYNLVQYPLAQTVRRVDLSCSVMRVTSSVNVPTAI